MTHPVVFAAQLTTMAVARKHHESALLILRLRASVESLSSYDSAVLLRLLFSALAGSEAAVKESEVERPRATPS